MESTLLLGPNTAETAAEAVPVFGKILVAVDQFDTDKSAVKFAGVMGARSGASLRVLHVREREHYGRRTFALETPDEARELVGEAVGDLRRSGLEAEATVKTGWVGRTWQVIVDEAANWGADVIVIGTPGPRRLFGRRTRELLMRKSPVPVLVAPKPSTGFETEKGRPATRRAA